MKRLWKITLYEIKDGYKVVIEGDGGYAEGRGLTPEGYAERRAMLRRVKIARIEALLPKDAE